MREPVHGGLNQGYERQDFVQRHEQRIGRVGTAFCFLALGNQLKQHGGLELGAPG